MFITDNDSLALLEQTRRKILIINTWITKVNVIGNH